MSKIENWTDNHVTYLELVSKELDHLAVILQHNTGCKKEVKKIIILQKENENNFSTFNHFKNRKIAQIYYYDPQSAGINVQSPQR